MLTKLTELYLLISNSAKSNPVLAAGLGLYGLGIVTYIIRDIPKSLWQFIVRQCTTTLIVNNSDAIYYDLLKWATEKKINSFVRNLTLGRSSRWGSSSQDSMLSVGYGVQRFLLNGRPMSLLRIKEQTQTLNTENKESVCITALGRSHKCFEDLFKIIKSNDDSEKYFKVYVYNKDYWKQVSRQFKRDLNSVSLPKIAKNEICDHIGKFLNDKKWYIDNGIPYRTGLLFYGPPGTGKTSLIKSLCSKYNKDLYLISLNNMTDSSLRDALADVPEGGLVAIEDIDASNVTHSRSSKDIEEEDSLGIGMLTLSGILNAIDGPASGEGRILIATTNHLENLDPALIREGRIDLKVKVDYMADEEFKAYLARFYKDLPDLSDYTIKPNTAPCQVQSLVFKYRTDFMPVLNEIADKVK